MKIPLSKNPEIIFESRKKHINLINEVRDEL